MKKTIWLTTIPVLALVLAIALKGSGVTSAAYNTIKNAGSALTQRPTLNFTGGGCSDNAGANETDCTGGGGSSLAIEVSGGAPNTPTTLNFAVSSTGCTLGTTGTTTQTVTWTCTIAGGVVGYSAPAVTLPAAGTTFVPYVGGGLPSATETNVQAAAPVASVISNMYVTMSTAIGAGNTVAFTYRDNASSQTVTCTISGASAKTCSDLTHSFTPAVGDALAIQIVTTGTVVATPNVQITTQYGAAGGGGGGGATVHHQYFMASNASTGGSARMMDVNGVDSSFLSAVPIGTIGSFGSGGGGVAGVIIYLPSTWSSAAGITVKADSGPSDNNTGNFSLQPEYFCIPNGYDLGASPSYTTGSAISVAAPGGVGTGFYRELIAMNLASPTCSAGDSIFIAVTRPSGDSYSHNVILYGLDIGITY